MREPLISNVPLLQKALDHIEAYPEEWDQDTWGTRSSCGTTACLAGHIALLTGWEPGNAHTTPDLPGGEEWSIVVKDGRYVPVSEVALEELGVPAGRDPSDQVRNLFDSTNTRFDLWSLGHILTNGQLTLPADLSD